MKKRIFKFLSVFALSVFISSPLIAEDAVVTFVKGKVEVLKGENWVALNVGDTLKQTDTVSTGFQSEAKIKFNGSLMALGALTRITMDQLSAGNNNEKVDVYLSTGAVRSKVTHSEDTRVSYTVRSPVAVASVRGTEFQLTDKGSVTCFSGAVAVYPNTKPKTAGKSEESTEESTEAESSDSPANDNVAMGNNDSSDVSSDNSDNTPAKPTTPAGGINPDAPNDAVVVGASQKTSFTKSGTPEKPVDNANKNITKVKSTVSTQAAKEAVSSSGSTITAANGPTTVPTTPKTGSITINITFEE